MAPWSRAALLLGAVLAVDQLTKALARSGIDPGDEDAILPGVQLVHVRNEGVAFGLLSGGGKEVVVVVGLALVALAVYFVTHSSRPHVWLPTGLLLGGALGNVIDRLRDGAVTDFVKIPLWPAFNVADISITAGVLVLLYVLERPGHPDAADGRA